jgi:hypothetical protein
MITKIRGTVTGKHIHRTWWIEVEGMTVIRVGRRRGRLHPYHHPLVVLPHTASGTDGDQYFILRRFSDASDGESFVKAYAFPEESESEWDPAQKKRQKKFRVIIWGRNEYDGSVQSDSKVFESLKDSPDFYFKNRKIHYILRTPCVSWRPFKRMKHHYVFNLDGVCVSHRPKQGRGPYAELDTQEL